MARLKSDASPNPAWSASKPEFDGSILGKPSGFSYATGREKLNVKDWGLQMVSGRHAKQRKKT